VKSPSEQIRDKDNHAIDAAKYLFMLTHDLRPEKYRLADDRMFAEAGGMLNVVPTQATSHDDVYRTTMMSDTGSMWSIYGSDSYENLES